MNPQQTKPPCGFCKGQPVGNAATWLDGKERPPCRTSRLVPERKGIASNGLLAEHDRLMYEWEFRRLRMLQEIGPLTAAEIAIEEREAMSKMKANVRREDGKIVKHPGFVPPDMTEAVKRVA